MSIVSPDPLPSPDSHDEAKIEFHECTGCHTTIDKEEMILCLTCFEYFCLMCSCDCVIVISDLDG